MTAASRSVPRILSSLTAVLLLFVAACCLVGLVVYGASACMEPVIDRLVNVPSSRLGGALLAPGGRAGRCAITIARIAVRPMVGGR